MRIIWHRSQGGHKNEDGYKSSMDIIMQVLKITELVSNITFLLKWNLCYIQKREEYRNESDNIGNINTIFSSVSAVSSTLQ